MESSVSAKSVDTQLNEKASSGLWCAGCGIGSVAGIFVEAVKEKGLTDDSLALYSGVGCSSQIPRVLHYEKRVINDSMFVNAILNDRDRTSAKKKVVFFDNADLMYSGLRDWSEVGECQDVLFIHINNLVYVEAENGIYANTPFARRTSKYGDLPFNMPAVAISCGARLVARWTPLRIGWFKYSIIDALSEEGFSYVEMLSPCVIFQSGKDFILSASDRFRFYDEKAEFNDNAANDCFDLRSPSKIAIGTLFNKSL